MYGGKGGVTGGAMGGVTGGAMGGMTDGAKGGGRRTKHKATGKYVEEIRYDAKSHV